MPPKVLGEFQMIRQAFDPFAEALGQIRVGGVDGGGAVTDAVEHDHRFRLIEPIFDRFRFQHGQHRR